MEKGGQNMINIQEFDKALKISCLRKQSTQTQIGKNFHVPVKLTGYYELEKTTMKKFRKIPKTLFGGL